MIKISPSVLASDFSQLSAEAVACEDAGADMLHLDVMDGCFVPNITFGAPIIKAIRPHTKLIFDVHLMIENPIKYISDFANAGADIITFHYESSSDVKNTIDAIKSCGVKVGIALKPATKADVVFPFLDYVDMILVMTVEPGFGGQSFMPDQIEKIKIIRDECTKRGLNTDIQVDGGITDKTAKSVIDAGANVLVAGSFVFKGDKANNINSLKNS